MLLPSDNRESPLSSGKFQEAKIAQPILQVVFFAERDINPGEEITYDYHFNHEDEGKKIPCFCNSKNCRRYLN